MSRLNEASNHGIPAPPDVEAWRHWGDGLAGRIVATRPQGYYADGAEYYDLAVDADGKLKLAADVSVDLGAVEQGTGAAAAAPWSMRLSDGSAFYKALTDADLRATPVPVSGTVATGGLTDAQLRASAVPVTANAGTNLNTSLLALESGGNLASIAGKDFATQTTLAQIKALLPAALVSGRFSVDIGGQALAKLLVTADPITFASAQHVVVDSATIAALTDSSARIGGTVAVTESGTWTVQPGNTANTTPWIVTQTPATSGGWSIANMTAGDGSTALTNSAQSIKGSAGQLGGWYISNPNTASMFVVIYNVASGSVTVGTTNPVMVLEIPAQGAANLEIVNGLAFSTAISVAAATTAGGNGAPTTALNANFFYK